MSRENSMSRGEFHLCRGGNSVSRGKFRVEGEIPCPGGNSVSGGIPCRWGNPVSMEFRGHPTVHLVEKNFKKCFYYKYLCFFIFFQKCFSGLADFRDL